jgi:hypothetical protein
MLQKHLDIKGIGRVDSVSETGIHQEDHSIIPVPTVILFCDHSFETNEYND